MRIFNFSFGDRVRITRTNLSGTVMRTGGQFAIVELPDRKAVRYPLTRLRHLDSFYQLSVKRGQEKIKHILVTLKSKR
jgi:hypothetical protein